MRLERNSATEARTREVSSSRVEAVRYVERRPATRLRRRMAARGRVRLGPRPQDWNERTSTVPVAGPAGSTTQRAAIEMHSGSRRFPIPGTLRRRWRNLWRRQSVPRGLAGGSPRGGDSRSEQTKMGGVLVPPGGTAAGLNRGGEEAKQDTTKHVSRARTDGDRASSRGADDE